MAFSPFNDLEREMLLASKEAPRLPNFFQLLMESEVLFLAFQGPQSENQEEFRIQQLEVNGEVFIPFFSAVERIYEALPRDTPFYRLNGRIFFEVVREHVAVLNPYSQLGWSFPPAQIEELLTTYPAKK